MNNLDDPTLKEKLDQSHVYESVIALPQQCQHAWEQLENFDVPEDYRKVNKVLMYGMGGSGLAARIIESVFGLKLKIPLLHLHDYDLPTWVDENTLVICSAFSGETEEPVEATKQAIKRGCKLMTIGSGGTIIELAKANHKPFYQIDPVYNPSKQPRMAIGYSLIGQLVMFSRAGLIEINEKDIADVCLTMKTVISECATEITEEKNPAKQMAMSLHNKIVVLFAARHLTGAAHLVKNQLNENSKNFAVLFDLPELNHHLLEGLGFPNTNKDTLGVVTLNSTLYPERIQMRFKITEEIIDKYHISWIPWQATATNTFAQTFEFIQFGSFVEFYLSMLNDLNPAPIPWVDYFKQQLGQPLGQWK